MWVGVCPGGDRTGLAAALQPLIFVNFKVIFEKIALEQYLDVWYCKFETTGLLVAFSGAL